MKVPDKVYIRSQAFETPWPPYMDENANHGGEEYIRKDVLLEWAQEKLQERHAPQFKDALGQLIDKLNLM